MVERSSHYKYPNNANNNNNPYSHANTAMRPSHLPSSHSENSTRAAVEAPLQQGNTKDSGKNELSLQFWSIETPVGDKCYSLDECVNQTDTSKLNQDLAPFIEENYTATMKSNDYHHNARKQNYRPKKNYSSPSPYNNYSDQSQLDSNRQYNNTNNNKINNDTGDHQLLHNSNYNNYRSKPAYSINQQKRHSLSQRQSEPSSYASYNSNQQQQHQQYPYKNTNNSKGNYDSRGDGYKHNNQRYQYIPSGNSLRQTGYQSNNNSNSNENSSHEKAPSRSRPMQLNNHTIQGSKFSDNSNTGNTNYRKKSQPISVDISKIRGNNAAMAESLSNEKIHDVEIPVEELQNLQPQASKSVTIEEIEGDFVKLNINAPEFNVEENLKSNKKDLKSHLTDSPPYDIKSNVTAHYVNLNSPSDSQNNTQQPPTQPSQANHHQTKFSSQTQYYNRSHIQYSAYPYNQQYAVQYLPQPQVFAPATAHPSYMTQYDPTMQVSGVPFIPYHHQPAAAMMSHNGIAHPVYVIQGPAPPMGYAANSEMVQFINNPIDYQSGVMIPHQIGGFNKGFNHAKYSNHHHQQHHPHMYQFNQNFNRLQQPRYQNIDYHEQQNQHQNSSELDSPNQNLPLKDSPTESQKQDNQIDNPTNASQVSNSNVIKETKYMTRSVENPGTNYSSYRPNNVRRK